MHATYSMKNIERNITVYITYGHNLYGEVIDNILQIYTIKINYFFLKKMCLLRI